MSACPSGKHMAVAVLLSVLNSAVFSQAQAGVGYGQQGFTCLKKMPDGSDVQQLDLTNLRTNNLGGQGPGPGTDPVILYEHVLNFNGRWLNLILSVIGPYVVNNPSKNGLDGNAGKVNVKSGTETDLRYTFVDAITGVPTIIPWLQFGTYKFDQNNAGKPKCHTIGDFASFALVPGSTVIVTPVTATSAQFCSNEIGIGNHVNDVYNINPDQARISVAMLFQNVYEIKMRVDLVPLNPDGGRNYEFSGNIDSLCSYIPTEPSNILTSPDGVVSVGFPSQLTASCVFDTLQATTYLSQAGTAIDAAVRSCDRNGPQPPTAAYPGSTACWIDVTTIIESFGYAASFLSSAANQCDLYSQNVNAQCAADVTGLVAAIADLHQAGGGMSQDCPDGAAHAGRPKPNIVPVPPGLLPHKQTPLQRTWGAQTAMCAIDAMQATWYLGKAGLNIDAAKMACPESNAAYCSTSVSAVISSFAYVATYVASAAAQCMHGLNPDAGCASDVARLVAGLGSVAARASSMSRFCTGDAAKDSKYRGEPTEWLQRRLVMV